MHHLKLPLLIILSILYFSCSKDKAKPSSEVILGKWEFVSFVRVRIDGQVDTETYGSISTFEFTSFGTLITRLDSDKDGTIDPGEMVSSTYTISNDKVRLGHIFPGNEFRIKTLTPTSLVLEIFDGPLEINLNLKK